MDTGWKQSVLSSPALCFFNQALKLSLEYLDCCFLVFVLWYFHGCYFEWGECDKREGKVSFSVLFS